MIIDIRYKLCEAIKTKNQQLKQLEFNHNLIISELSLKQYFQWNRKYFNGDLDYKSQALSVLRVSKSKKIQRLVENQVSLYNSLFGHSAEVIQLRKAV